MFWVNQRANLRLGLQWVALPQFGCALFHARQHFIGNIFLHQNARARQTHLPGVVILIEHVVQRQIEIGIIKDQQWRFATQLKANRREVGRRVRANNARRLWRAGERDARNIFVLHQRITGFFANALHHIEHTRRQTRLVRKVGKQRAGEWRPLRRLQHHRAACSQRWPQLPCAKHKWRIPGRDERSHARWLIQHFVVGLAMRCIKLIASKLGCVFGEPVDIVRPTLHHAQAAGLVQRAVVGGLYQREIRHTRLNHMSQLFEVGQAAFWPQRGPSGKGGFGCGDCGVYLGLPASRNLRNDFAINGANVLKCLRRGHTLPTDVMIG